jgi:hypothetical protein
MIGHKSLNINLNTIAKHGVGEFGVDEIGHCFTLSIYNRLAGCVCYVVLKKGERFFNLSPIILVEIFAGAVILATDETSRFPIRSGKVNEAGEIVDHLSVAIEIVDDVAVVPLDEHTFISLTVLLNSGRRDMGLDATVNSCHSS